MENIIIEYKEYVVLVVYSFSDLDVCNSFSKNIKGVLSACSEITRTKTIEAPLLRPDIFND